MTRINMIKCSKNNVYVLHNEDENKAILVDTGSIKNRKALLERIKQYPIKLIILTHGHFDHCANARFFKDYFNAKIAISEKEIPLVLDNLYCELTAIETMGIYLKKISKMQMAKKKNKIEEFDIDIFLEEGFSLKEYGIDANIVDLAGHTKGSIGIKSENSFIVGDALMNFLKPTYSLIAEDVDALKESIEKLYQSNVKVFYCGHGNKILYNQIF